MNDQIIPFHNFKSFVTDGGDKTKALVTKDITNITVDVDNRKISFVASTDRIDRQNDSIIQNGWQLERYNKNPVVLWDHQWDEPPIGKGSVVVQNNKLLITVEFLPASNPWNGAKAEGIFQMLCNGYLAAVSVGFKVLDFDIPDDADRYGVNITAMELLEVSVTPIPANPDCLVIPSSIPQQEEAMQEMPQPDPVITASFDEESEKLKRLWRIQASL